MTEHTPEKVAEARAKLAQHAMRRDLVEMPKHIHAVLDALTAASADVEMWKQETDDAKAYAALVEADRDRLHKAITEALDHDPLHGRSCLHVILRAALDKEGNDDENS